MKKILLSALLAIVALPALAQTPVVGVPPGSDSLPSGVTSPGTGSLTGSGSFQAKMLDAGGAVFNVKAYGAKGDGRGVNDAAITSGSATLTSATAAFTSADTGKTVSIAMGTHLIASGTYTSGITATGTVGQTCNLAMTNGGGTGATATVFLTSTNTIAAGTFLTITAQGTGFSANATTATAANGTATCSGTATIATTLAYGQVTTTATYVNATTITLGVTASNTVSSARLDIGTNDCAALTAANAALTATGGGTVLYPAGNYYVGSACNLTVSVPFTLQGVGRASYDQATWGAMITSTDPSGILFLTTAKVGRVADLGVQNTAAAPISGAAFSQNGAYFLAQVNFENNNISGFYDNIDNLVGALWMIHDNVLNNPVRYDVYVDNVGHTDSGDWIFSDNFVAGQTRLSAGGLFVAGAGGGKVANNKFIGGGATAMQSGLLMLTSGSVTGQLIFVHNDVEQMSGPPVNVLKGYAAMTFTDNYLATIGGAGNPNIYCNFCSNAYIGGGVLVGAATTPYAIDLASSSNVTIMPFFSNVWTTAPVNTSSVSGTISNLSNLGPWFPYSGTTQFQDSQTTVQAAALLKSTLATGSGHAAWTLDKGSTNAEATIDYSTTSTLDWRAGMHADADYSIKDQVNGKTPFRMVANTPTGAISSNTAGATLLTIQTATNCAVNSVSPAACGSAAAGAVVVPTTTTTYTVNTTAVQSTSRIFLFPMTFASNLPSTPTCVSPAVTSHVTISAIVAATSFTFAMPSTSGQTCWSYEIVN